MFSQHIIFLKFSKHSQKLFDSAVKFPLCYLEFLLKLFFKFYQHIFLKFHKIFLILRKIFLKLPQRFLKFLSTFYPQKIKISLKN